MFSSWFSVQFEISPLFVGRCLHAGVHKTACKNPLTRFMQHRQWWPPWSGRGRWQCLQAFSNTNTKFIVISIMKKYNLPINYQTTKNMLKAFEHCDTFLVIIFLLKFQPLWSYFWYHHHRHDGPLMMKMAGIWRTGKEKELILFGQRSGNKCIPLSTLHYDDDVHDDGDDVDVGAHHHDVDDNLSSLLSKTHIVVLMSWSEL